MPLLHAIILGAVQGLTEFLPISSDGHLVVMDMLLNINLPGRSGLGFDILLHGGSLLALLLLDRMLWWKILSSPFRRDKEGMRLLLLLIISVIPAAIIGLLFEDVIAIQLRATIFAALGFILTGLVLILGENIGRNGKDEMKSISLWQTILIGCAQAVALLPGVSRSGCTTSAARALGLSREAALRFSFLMVVPAICGALAKTGLDVIQGQVTFPALHTSLAGFASSFVVSIVAILFLRHFVSRYSLSWFALYLFPLAAFLLFQIWEVHHLIDLHHVEQYVRQYGSAAVFGFSLIETIPPLGLVSPGVFALIIAGSLANNLSTIVWFLGAAASGAMLGNIIMFYLGSRYGRTIAHRFHLTEDRLTKVDQLMKRFGVVAVIVGQFVGIARPVMAFVAGTSHLSRRVYFPCMLLGTLLWASYNMMIGYFGHDNLLFVLPFVGIAGYLLPAIGAVILGIYEWINHLKKKKAEKQR